jgi:general nucleoside transport system ATP-binding protein
MKQRAGRHTPNNHRHVEMRDIVKCFPGVRANSKVCFDVEAGEVHALLGENGAGKSTLMRQLYGLYQPDEGDIIIDGKRLAFRSPADAIKAGIGMIHQHFMLVPTLTVAQNVALGQPSSRAPLLDLKKVTQRIQELSEEYGLKVDPRAYVWQLSVGEQQRVEIMKTLYRGARLIILDEPTAVLTPQEVEDLFSTLRRMVKEGHSLVFISHKLHEVMAISDRVTVLRDGKVIGTRATREVTRSELVRMMVGRELKELEPRPREPGSLRLLVTDLHAMGDRGTEALKGINLAVHAGEIVGLAGVSGNGQRELAECLAGMRKVKSGQLRLADADITAASLNERVDAGMAYIPEERMRDGAIREFSVQENIFLHDHASARFTHGIFLSFSRMQAHAAGLVRDFAVKTAGLDAPLKNLSGGNIQKLIMARELSRRPAMLVAAQPTRGVDISSTAYIHQRLLAQRESGTAILLISEDLDEICALSDRIAVMYEGRIIGLVDRGEASVEQLGLMMAGVPQLEALRKAASPRAPSARPRRKPRRGA